MRKEPHPTLDPTPTPEYEMIAVTMPEQQAEVAGEKIIKAVIGQFTACGR
ncbi:MAG: hypothetical protein ACLTY5_00480 [Angelakisella sp.]